MSPDLKPVEPAHIACKMCLKEVPLSEANTFEATDYVVHFCGLECFEQWKKQGEKPEEQAKNPGA